MINEIEKKNKSLTLTLNYIKYMNEKMRNLLPFERNFLLEFSIDFEIKSRLFICFNERQKQKITNT